MKLGKIFSCGKTEKGPAPYPALNIMKGYALDVFLDWDASDQLIISLSLEDVISEIIWEQVPVAMGMLSFDRQPF